MNKMQRTSLLQLPLSDLELSEGFKKMAACHDFRNLQDILNWPASVLLMHQGFTYHIYHELRGFLHQNRINHLLKAESL